MLKNEILTYLFDSNSENLPVIICMHDEKDYSSALSELLMKVYKIKAYVLGRFGNEINYNNLESAIKYVNHVHFGSPIIVIRFETNKFILYGKIVCKKISNIVFKNKVVLINALEITANNGILEHFIDNKMLTKTKNLISENMVSNISSQINVAINFYSNYLSVLGVKFAEGGIV